MKLKSYHKNSQKNTNSKTGSKTKNPDRISTYKYQYTCSEAIKIRQTEILTETPRFFSWPQFVHGNHIRVWIKTRRGISPDPNEWFHYGVNVIQPKHQVYFANLNKM